MKGGDMQKEDNEDEGKFKGGGGQEKESSSRVSGLEPCFGSPLLKGISPTAAYDELPPFWVQGEPSSFSGKRHPLHVLRTVDWDSESVPYRTVMGRGLSFDRGTKRTTISGQPLIECSPAIRDTYTVASNLIERQEKCVLADQDTSHLSTIVSLQ